MVPNEQLWAVLKNFTFTVYTLPFPFQHEGMTRFHALDTEHKMLKVQYIYMSRHFHLLEG